MNSNTTNTVHSAGIDQHSKATNHVLLEIDKLASTQEENNISPLYKNDRLFLSFSEYVLQWNLVIVNWVLSPICFTNERFLLFRDFA